MRHTLPISRSPPSLAPGPPELTACSGSAPRASGRWDGRIPARWIPSRAAARDGIHRAGIRPSHRPLARGADPEHAVSSGGPGANEGGDRLMGKVWRIHIIAEHGGPP